MSLNMRDQDVIGVIGEFKMAAKNAVYSAAYEVESGAFSKDAALGLASKFLEDILCIPAEKYLPGNPGKNRVILGGMDFSIFGEAADRMKAIFTICQLRDVSPTFDKFLKENPQYDEHNQSADNKD